MRVSDAERQRVIDELRRHCAAGRLDVDEYAARLERAMTASSLEELDSLRSDLPMLRIGEPAGHSDPRIWARGSVPDRLSEAKRDDGAPGGLRLAALAVAVLSVALVLAVIVLSVAVSWTWAAVLLAGWVIGVVQGRARGRAHT